MAKKQAQPVTQKGTLFESLEQKAPEILPVPTIASPEIKTKSERVAEWQESGRRMLKWFEDLKQLPPEPIQVNRHTRIIDVKKFIETQKATVEANMGNPFNRVFMAAYMRLFELKKNIEP